MKFILATSNAHKIKEIKKILKNNGCDAEFEARAFDVVEDGETYEENALKKAKHAYEESGIPSVADDSGLEIDALKGMLGIHSARFMEGRPYTEKNAEILRLMKDVPQEKRTARFICVVVYYDGTARYFRGVVEGKIAKEAKGKEGFGYDPIFIPNGYKETMAQLGQEIKNKISHRAKAFGKLAKHLKEGL